MQVKELVKKYKSNIYFIDKDKALTWLIAIFCIFIVFFILEWTLEKSLNINKNSILVVMIIEIFLLLFLECKIPNCIILRGYNEENEKIKKKQLYGMLIEMKLNDMHHMRALLEELERLDNKTDIYEFTIGILGVVITGISASSDINNARPVYLVLMMIIIFIFALVAMNVNIFTSFSSVVVELRTELRFLIADEKEGLTDIDESQGTCYSKDKMIERKTVKKEIRTNTVINDKTKDK